MDDNNKQENVFFPDLLVGKRGLIYQWIILSNKVNLSKVKPTDSKSI